MAELIYGKNLIKQRLMEDKKIHTLFLLKEQIDQEILTLAKEKRVPIIFMNRKQMDDDAKGGKHQGVMAKIDSYCYYELEEILASIPEGKTPLLVMLDGVEDPHNLGAVLRTCDAAGVDGVLLGKHRSVSLNATVAKVSVGAIETVKVAEVTNLNQTIKQLKEKGFWICGSEMNAKDYRQADFTIPLVLVVGSEGFGISSLVKKNCDFVVSVPMQGKINSLNVSVATGVLLYEVLKQRFPV
jgi:rRNA methylase, putative, group 3